MEPRGPGPDLGSLLCGGLTSSGPQEASSGFQQERLRSHLCFLRVSARGRKQDTGSAGGLTGAGRGRGPGHTRVWRTVWFPSGPWGPRPGLCCLPPGCLAPAGPPCLHRAGAEPAGREHSRGVGAVPSGATRGCPPRVVPPFLHGNSRDWLRDSGSGPTRQAALCPWEVPCHMEGRED